MSALDDLKRHFEELKAASLQDDARAYGTQLWVSWHKLAEDAYPPAKEFLEARLDDPRFDWRELSVSLLGFHFALEDRILEKIRYILLHDADSTVRGSAASVLGSQGKFPESALINALRHDTSRLMRATAFFALLELSGVPYETILDARRSVKSEEIIPSVDQLKRVLRDHHLEQNLRLLEESRDV